MSSVGQQPLSNRVSGQQYPTGAVGIDDGMLEDGSEDAIAVRPPMQSAVMLNPRIVVEIPLEFPWNGGTA